MGWERMSLDPMRVSSHFQGMLTVPGAQPGIQRKELNAPPESLSTLDHSFAWRVLAYLHAGRVRVHCSIPGW